jgi:8-oxo-dGTP pyrophosphatase MutT (NUDIX family)
MSQLFSQDDYHCIYTSGQNIDIIQMRNEVFIVSLTDQREVILTIEPSIAFGEPTLILPGGVTEPNEAHKQTVLRELQEEIGFTAAQ